ncbi:LapD/MoxY N-terminal periplasmic domain-containing protein [Pontibacter sp. JAM-7]|uniref:bifunctional diguanylate cyclase/phosphodiesterase n=1 Tax=Pontibacter sp. JAM-7 TaxID=3366581 RepID=UPI003AF9465C
MTLSKQLLLLISLIFLAIFSVNYITSINNIREYLQVESEVHAQDTATSMGLSLSPYILDETDPILETMVNTIFDRGYYLEILLESNKGKELVRKTNPKSFAEVPEWFTNLLPMTTATAQSDIDAGWIPGGTIYVTIHPGFGYLKLWQQAKRSLAYSAIAFAVSVLLLIIMLRWVLSPLSRISKQARNIADGKFETIDNLPWTTEIRYVAESMNLMSGKIEKVITNLNSRLEETGKRLRVDDLTGLETRSTFETEMKERFISRGQGHIFLVRIADLGGFASTRSSGQVDDFIREFVDAVRHGLTDAGVSGDCLYRIVGAEFILIADCADQAAAEGLCQKILARMEQLGSRYDKADVAHMGGVAFDPHSTTAAMVAAATEAYEKALLIGANSFAINQDSGNARGLDEWKALVSKVISERRIEIEYAQQAYSLADGSTDQLVLEEAMSSVQDDNGQALPIGTFVSVAETLGEIVTFDMFVVRTVLEQIRSRQIQHRVAVNLSFTTLSNNNFRSELYRLLQDNADIAGNLVFSITAYAATKDLTAFKSFIDFAHRSGAKVILKRFESRFISLDTIKEYQLDYIRLARAYTEQISRDPEKRSWVEALKELGELLNIEIVAEAVETDADYQTVKEIGITAASR